MKLLIFLLSLIAISSFSQDSTFTSDRPGVSTPTDIVGQNSIQLEIGIQHESYVNNSNLLIPTSLLRYGLYRNVEFRINADFSYDRDGTDISKNITPTISSKVSILKQNGILPSISTLCDLTINKYYMFPSFYILMSNSINKFNIVYNYGYISDIIHNNVYSFCLGYNITNRLNYFIEYYGSSNKYESNSYIDSGVSYMVAGNIQIDISASKSLKSGDYFLIGSGISWNIKNKHKHEQTFR